MLLTSILVIPPAAALLCLLMPWRWLMEWINILAFAATLALGVQLLHEVLAQTVVTEWNEFFYADALSAWMVLLISAVSLGASLYAGRYFRRDLAAGVVTAGRVKEFFVLTPLFAAGMFLVVLANNLGVMWFAVEATALSSVLLVALYNRKTSLEAAWKYVMLGSLGLALALVRHGVHLRGGHWTGRKRTAAEFQLVAPDDGGDAIRPAADQAGVCLRARRLRHQGRPGTDAYLAARRAQRSAVADQRHAVRRVAQSRDLCPAPLSHSHHAHASAPGSAARCCWVSACSPCSWPRRSFSCRAISNGCSPTPASNTSASSAPASALNTPVTIFGALLHMGYHALTKPVLFFAAGNIHQTFHTLKLRVIGPGVIKVLPVTVLFMGLAAVAAMGLPPFGLFYSELTVLSGGFAAGRTFISFLILAALIAAFCGILKQLTRILLGARKVERPNDAKLWDGVPAMGLLVGGLLVFSIWFPDPLLQLIHQAAGIIRGKS